MKLRHLFILLFCLPAITWAQDNAAQRDMKKALFEIEEKHGIKFSFVDEVVSDRKVFYDTALDIGLLIKQLELASRLRFVRVSKDYVIIRPYRDDDLVSLCGRISSHFGEELLGTSIAYSETEGVFTNENGYFQLDSIPYGSWLTLRSVGYATKRLKVSRLDFKKCIDIRMAESINELEEIVVSDYLAAGITKSKNEIQIKPQRLKALAGLAEPDILNSIQQVPGVNSPFETAAGIHVRGGLPDQNLVIWNGIRTYNQGHFFGMISAFNPYLSDQIIFIKDGTPSAYGGGISSVIDISSNEGVSKELSGGVGTNLLYADGFIDIPMSKTFSVKLSARRSFTDIISTPTFNTISDRVFQNTKIEDSGSSDIQKENNFFFNDFSFNSNWSINENNNLIISGLYNRNELDFESSNADQNQAFNDLLLHANEGLNIRWKSSIEEKWEVEVNSSFSRYILRYDFIETVSDTVTQSSKKNFVQDGDFRINTQYQFSSKSRLTAGYQMSNIRMRYAYETESPSFRIVLDSDNSQVTTHAGYAEYLVETNGFSIQPGIRFNYYHQLDDYFVEPRLYLRKQLTNSVAASLSGEYKTQVTSQIKESVVSDLSLENKVWAISSADRFPVLKSYQLSGGVSYQDEGWFAEAEIYTKQIDGVTTLIFGYLNGLENGFRVGESNTTGIDVLAKKVLSNYETWISYSYIRTLNSFDGINNDEVFPGSWNIEHTLRSSHIFTLKNWELSLGWLLHTGKSFTDVTVSDDSSGPVQVFYEAINANNLPVYHRLDFAATREFRSNKHSNLRYRLGVSLLNLYNRRNILNREFRTTPSLDNELIDTRVYSLGFTPNIVFRVFW